MRGRDLRDGLVDVVRATREPARSPIARAEMMVRKKSMSIFSPASTCACSSPPVWEKRRTRNPSNPELRSASRYSDSYMPNRHGPHPPAVR